MQNPQEKLPEVVESETVIRTIQQYRCVQLIGQGGFGVVYQCRQEKEVFAIKVMFETKKFSVEFFEKECRTMKSIENQNVVRYIEAFITEDGFYCIVMEYCNMGSLRDYMSKKNIVFFPYEEAMNYFIQILNGFRGIHKAKIIHRDLQVHNILLSDGQIKIADFGLAQQMKDEMVQSFCGTKPYMAPEILAKKQYSYQVDIWSLGVILFKLLFGVEPFGSCAREQRQLKSIMDCFEYDQFYLSLALKGNQVAQTVGLEVLDLFQKIFVINPKKRISFKQLYQHPVLVQQIEKQQREHLKEKFKEKIEVYEQPNTEMLQSNQNFGANQQFQIPVQQNKELRIGTPTVKSLHSNKEYGFTPKNRQYDSPLYIKYSQEKETFISTIHMIDLRKELVGLSGLLKREINMYVFAIQQYQFIFEVYQKVKNDPLLSEILGHDNKDYFSTLKFFISKLAYFFAKNTHSIITQQMNSFMIENEQINWRGIVTSKFYPKLLLRSQQRLLEIQKQYELCLDVAQSLEFQIIGFQKELETSIYQDENLNSDPQIPEDFRYCSRVAIFQCYSILQKVCSEKSQFSDQITYFQRYSTLFLVIACINHIYILKSKQFALNDYIKTYEEFNLVEFFDWFNQVDNEFQEKKESSFIQLNQHILQNYLQQFADQTNYDFQIFGENVVQK